MKASYTTTEFNHLALNTATFCDCGDAFSAILGIAHFFENHSDTVRRIAGILDAFHGRTATTREFHIFKLTRLALFAAIKDEQLATPEDLETLEYAAS